MADTLLSIVLEKLALVVQQQIEQEIRLVVGVQDEVEYLRNTLLAVRDVLEDAERREVNDKAVQNWLEKLKNMAYQMDDVVDAWSTALLRLRTNSQHKREVSSCNIFPSPCMCSKQVSSRRDIALKIQAVRQQLDVIDSEKSRLNFAMSSRSEEGPSRLITTSAVDVSVVCGRDVDQNTIVGHLLDLGRSTSRGEKSIGLYVISIIGVGGMGKTTLAQLAYNHPHVKVHFDERIWVCVSDPFDPIRVYRAIVEALRKSPCNLHDLEAIQQEIQTCISGKKFLLVLDDVWTENHQLWDQLKNTLAIGAAESRILVTTRKQGVVMMVGTAYTHSLEQLPRESSWALFHQIAFSGKSREKEEELKVIGEKIVDKCKGLPLAIKALGYLLRSKNSKVEWEAILNSEVWKLDVFGRDISPALLISYYDLMPPIKRCFTFCAIFPKDTMLEVDQLIQLWMAHGYPNLDTSEEMEIVGRGYFEHLAARSFFQDFEKDDDGNIMKCKMHDIVHDFAQLLAKNECFITEVDNDNDNQKEWHIHLSFIRQIHHAALIGRETTSDFGLAYEMKGLRTLLIQPEFLSSIDEALLRDLFGGLTSLRALDLGSNVLLIKELPERIRKLIHLRYLNLSNCRMLECLPVTICDLCNLQTLNINGCIGLKNLPQAMGKLINLRHLQNARTYRVKDLPRGIGRLESLRTVRRFIVSSSNADKDGYKCRIKDLRDLNNLRGSLQILGLDEVKNAAEAEEAKLKNKVHLHHLSLWFSKKEGRKGVGEGLQPPPNLKSLFIYDYGEREWPNWMMMGSLFTQLKTLLLSYCRACPCLPPLGQLPALEELEIGGAHSVKYIGDEFLGSSSSLTTAIFPKLKKLSFHNMKEWAKWEVREEAEGRSIMSCLSFLRIRKCPCLEGLPYHVLQRTPLQELVITDSDILSTQAVPTRYRRGVNEGQREVSFELGSSWN